jgi:hypothetical protein
MNAMKSKDLKIGDTIIVYRKKGDKGPRNIKNGSDIMEIIGMNGYVFILDTTSVRKSSIWCSWDFNPDN